MARQQDSDEECGLSNSGMSTWFNIADYRTLFCQWYSNADYRTIVACRQDYSADYRTIFCPKVLRCRLSNNVLTIVLQCGLSNNVLPIVLQCGLSNDALPIRCRQSNIRRRRFNVSHRRICRKPLRYLILQLQPDLYSLQFQAEVSLLQALLEKTTRGEKKKNSHN